VCRTFTDEQREKLLGMSARFLELEITGNCYYRCQHCYGAFPKEGRLAKNKIRQVIDEANEYFECIVFSGGEPFLHPDLIELTHYAKDFVVFITTSGYSISREQITDLYKVTEKDLEGIDLFCKGRYSISPGGEVRPCEFHPCVLGNIYEERLSEIIERTRSTDFMKSREEGFKKQVRLDLKNPFDYHTKICHKLAMETNL